MDRKTSIFYKVLGHLTMFLALWACQRNVDKDLFAPKTVQVEEGFEISSTPGLVTKDTMPMFQDEVGTRGDSVVYVGAFGKVVTWQLTYKGLSSGAIKSFAGTGSVLDTTNNKWKGNTDNQILFRTGEKVVVELSILGAKKRYFDTITVGRALNYIAFNRGLLIADFNSPLSGIEGGAYPPKGTSFEPLYSYIKILQTNDFQAIEGTGTLKFDGEDLENNSFIGGYYIQLGNENSTTPKVYPVDSTATPDKLWINVFIYGIPGASAQVDIVAKEFDSKPGVNGTLNWGDQYRARFVVEWTGWRLVSFKYSDFVMTPDALGGNNIKEPRKIKQFTINAGPNPNLPGRKVQFYADYYTLTYNEVFKF